MAYGDLEAEDARAVAPASLMKLFRLAQMAVEYLLFVQDRLAADNCAAQVRTGLSCLDPTALMMMRLGAGGPWPVLPRSARWGS